MKNRASVRFFLCPFQIGKFSNSVFGCNITQTALPICFLWALDSAWINQLNEQEVDYINSQTGLSLCMNGGLRYFPTDHCLLKLEARLGFTAFPAFSEKY